MKDTGFPGGPVVKHQPCNAGDTGWSLVQEDPTCPVVTKPAACWSPTATTEPECLESMLRNKGSHYNEKPTGYN